MRHYTNELIWILVFWDYRIYLIYEFLKGDIMNKNYKNNSSIFVEFLMEFLIMIIHTSIITDIVTIALYSGIRTYFLLYKIITGISSTMDLTILIQIFCVWTSVLIVTIGIIATFKLINEIKNIYNDFTSDENYDD